MKVINFFDTDNKEHWIGEIERSDWRAGAFLGRLLRSGEFFDAVGEDSRVLLLPEGEELISYCTFAEKDDMGSSGGNVARAVRVWVDVVHMALHVLVGRSVLWRLA